MMRAAIACTSILCVVSATSVESKSISMQTLLCEIIDRDAMARFPEPAYRCLQASSYNRESVAPDRGGWFADSDGIGFIRTEVNHGRTEWVIMESEGPGCITRIWTPYFYYDLNERVGPTARFYLDGSDRPVIEGSLIELLTEKLFVRDPFSVYTARAGDLYLPIPFAKHCKITLDRKSFYNIVNYRLYPPDTEVESFTMESMQSAKDQLEETGRILRAASAVCSGRSMTIHEDVLPRTQIEIPLRKGPRAIRELKFRLQSKDMPQALRSTILQMEFDGVPTVWCPLGDFFCSGNAVNPFQTWSRSVEADGLMVCRWVMPYRKSARVIISNYGEESVDLEARVQTGAWRWDERSMYFHANWRIDDPRPGHQFVDWNFNRMVGTGVFVGDAWNILSPGTGWWGEGDEKIYVDGDFERRFPSHFGTGTEDYYGWAGGVVPDGKDEFSHPFIANVRVGNSMNPRGSNICTRERSLDAIPFMNRFRMDIEASPGTDIRNPWNWLAYSAVTFWYGLPGAKSLLPPQAHEAAQPTLQLDDLDRLERETKIKYSIAP